MHSEFLNLWCNEGKNEKIFYLSTVLTMVKDRTLPLLDDYLVKCFLPLIMNHCWSCWDNQNGQRNCEVLDAVERSKIVGTNFANSVYWFIKHMGCWEPHSQFKRTKPVMNTCHEFSKVDLDTGRRLSAVSGRLISENLHCIIFFTWNIALVSG